MILLLIIAAALLAWLLLAGVVGTLLGRAIALAGTSRRERTPAGGAR